MTHPVESLLHNSTQWFGVVSDPACPLLGEAYRAQRRDISTCSSSRANKLFECSNIVNPMFLGRIFFLRFSGQEKELNSLNSLELYHAIIGVFVIA